MRLYKGGGVGLGPHAFAPTGEGRWRRIATGAPAPRADGYRLDENEASELVELAQTLEARPDPAGPLAWAVRRFELGCERPTALEGLSDHLLALRSVLDGQGPVGASLPMRAAALISAASHDRLAARERLEAAMQLERSQMGGAPSENAAGLAGWVEESVRRIMRDAALGELGADLNEAADETLIATGLDTGDVAIAVAEEVEPEPEPHVPNRPARRTNMEQDTRILEPVPAEDEIRVTDARDWLEEVEDERVAVEESTLDFPAVADDLARRERIDTPRVRHLFPVPEDADWDVKELKYDHYASAPADPQIKAARELWRARCTRVIDDADTAGQSGAAGGDLYPLLAAREQVAVDLGEAAEVVHVLVQVGDADHPLGAQLARQVLDVARVALGQRLVVGEVLADAARQVLVAEPLGQRRPRGRPGRRRRAAARPGSGPC